MTDELRFAKYEGCGNDFVMVVDLDDQRPLAPDQVASICDRRFGVGADGLIRLVRAPDAAIFMDYRNADGSLAEMCGNGIRCVAALARDAGLIDMPAFDVATRAGIRRVELGPEDRISVEMGRPAFARSEIPMRGPAWETFLTEPMDIGGGITVKATAVSIGNPHLVLLVEDDPALFHVAHIGAALEHHDLFPEGTNVEFAHVTDDAILARVWERGSRETMACGSGACAVAVAANEAGLAPARVVVRFPGGDLEVERREDGELVLSGSAERVFDGVVDLAALR
ncbi:MAG: diaminopimelate epimerase [Actinomycetota bacterium]